MEKTTTVIASEAKQSSDASGLLRFARNDGKLSLYIFRRDLRLEDNTALQQALTESEAVIPCFIFDTRQIENNPYKSEHALQFMAHSLYELDQTLREKNSQLYCFYGIAEEVVEQLITELNLDAVYVNRDYTPFSEQRDKKIAAACKKNQISFHSYADTLLNEPEAVHKSNRNPYTIFTAFFNQAKQIQIHKPITNTKKNYYQKPIPSTNDSILKKLLELSSPDLCLKGGRKEGLKLIQKIAKLQDYQEARNYPALQKTTLLSAHHKFGTVSIREVYHHIAAQFNSAHTLIKELYWRDFFTHIAFHFPKVFGHAFHDRYNQIHWSNNNAHFNAWCEGQTGFPIVDAGMRELNETGYMHNRVRMITASFLVKDLHIDWRRGEQYFAQQLIDYDPAVNNGNWQWAASTGCDAQPYFRIFNPWLQQKKFDADCVYIKQWLPELDHLSAKQIHELMHQQTLSSYPSPIVDHAIAASTAKRLFQRI